MKKTILKIFCICFITSNSAFAELEELKNFLDKPSSDFFITVVTKNNNSSLRHTEIEFLQLLLSQLFNSSMNEEQYTHFLENAFKKENEIQISGTKITGYLNTLQKYRDSKITQKEDMEELISIIKACNFLNKSPLIYGYQSTLSCKHKKNESFQLLFSVTKDNNFSLENLKNASGIIAFNEYFFGKDPFPHNLAQNYSENFSKINNHYLFACNFLTFTDEVKNIDLSSCIKAFNESKVGENPITTSQLNLSKEKNGKIMLENKTFYTLKEQVTLIYNKSSYFKENDEFLAKQEAFYYFGDKKDHTNEDQRPVANNISTEICRDVSLALRKDDPAINLHLIQANSLYNLKQYKRGLPPAWYYIFCDPCVMRKDIKSRNREGLSHLYFNATPIDDFIMMKACYSCSFELHFCRYDINIYKIIL